MKDCVMVVQGQGMLGHSTKGVSEHHIADWEMLKGLMIEKVGFLDKGMFQVREGLWMVKKSAKALMYSVKPHI